jgi:hypothetical protein
MLGFQKFDFNVLQVPFRLTFTNKTLKKESRAYVCTLVSLFALSSSSQLNFLFLNRHFPNNIVATTVVANVLINSEPTNAIYSIDLKHKPADFSFQAGDNAVVVPANPVSAITPSIISYYFSFITL